MLVAQHSLVFRLSLPRHWLLPDPRHLRPLPPGAGMSDPLRVATPPCHLLGLLAAHFPPLPSCCSGFLGSAVEQLAAAALVAAGSLPHHTTSFATWYGRARRTMTLISLSTFWPYARTDDEGTAPPGAVADGLGTSGTVASGISSLRQRESSVERLK